MLKAVFFDLDGTLVDSERQNAEAVARVLAARGRVVTDDERHFIIGHGWREIYARLQAAGDFGLSFVALLAAVAKQREQLVQTEGLLTLPGAVETVRRVTSQYASAIVSGSSREEIEFSIRALQIKDCFPWFISAEDVTRGKPHPGGYLQAATRLQLAPKECLVIEDSTAGIAAARSAGMRCVAVRAGNFANQPQDAADVVISTLHELTDELLVKLAV